MQQKWRQDSDKLTFIACLARQASQDSIVSTEHDAPERMVGDVNLFIYPGEDDHDEVIVEVELMVAKKSNQGKGLGKAILVAFLSYIAKHETEILCEFRRARSEPVKPGNEKDEIKYLRAKIGQENTRSISLFEKFGFQLVDKAANCFGEFELRLRGPLKEIIGVKGEALGLKNYQELPFDARRS